MIAIISTVNSMVLFPSALTSVLVLLEVGVLVTEFLMLRAHLLRSQVRLYMVQSLLVALLALVMGVHFDSDGLYVVSAMAVVVKVILVPMLIIRLLRTNQGDLSQSAVMKLPSMLYIALIASALGFFMAGPLSGAGVLGKGSMISRHAIPIELAVVFMAFVLIGFRRDVISQIVGFFSLENGITLISMSIAANMPFIVEVATFFDLLVAAVAFGLLMRLHHMKAGTLSTHTLERLKG
jgi:hydrogenase-4 component E